MSAARSGPPLRKGDHLYLIDGSGYIFRAFHALPPLTRKSDGLPVGAVSGFCNMLHKLLKESSNSDKPTHLAVVFDTARDTFRREIYPDYKANRPPPPPELVPQFALIRKAVAAFNAAAIEMDGYEADDLIATYARQAREAGATCTIVSSDKDLMQLIVDGSVALLDPVKARRIESEGVIEKFGVPPDKVVEVQALAGDSVDNVPGVPGIGVKTAAELISTYGDLETLLARADEIKQPKRREALQTFAEQARISRALVLLEDNVPEAPPVGDFAVTAIEPKRLISFLRALEFTTLTKRVASEFGVEDVDAIEADPAIAVSAGDRAEAAPDPAVAAGSANRPGAIQDEEAIRKPIDPASYRAIVEEEDLNSLIDAAYEKGVFAVDTETTSLDAMQAELVGIAIAVEPGSGFYIPVGHRGEEGLALSGTEGPKQLDKARVLAALKPLLEHPGVLKILQNAKYDLLVFAQHGITVGPIDDTMLISYVLDAGRNGHGMDELSERHLGHKPISFKEVAGSGKSAITFDRVPIERATAYSAEDADVTLRLHGLLKPRLVAERMVTVYETLERPLVPVLVEMERAGILVDRQVLSRLSGRFAQRMLALESEIHEQAGSPFNLGSPKQLGEILFERMKLPAPRTTKTGAYSTDADVLEELAAQGHEIPRLLLQWRQLQKLKGTYTDALPSYINPQTGRVHTSFAMASTSTGRLSSSDPNLQNIPIRSDEGRQIREAFAAPEGRKLISADYSQIELRLLAHIADIPELRQAFAEGKDIHAMTASEMFGVPLDKMTPEIRGRAKAINFGIIYGISAFGLANQLSIPRADADAYIKTYFERFPGIRTYMDQTKARAKKDGFVTTIFGRKAHYPQITSNVPSVRAFNERAAINAPIQGSAADIIRRAMIRVPPALKAAKLSAMMLLQVHDELIFEVPESEAKATCALVKDVMEKAALPALELTVPLIVEAKAGRTWGEAH
ncbi:MAG: DNA polymerase I [Alphaproteobacteria bacterium]|nr:DNA polymerase I [Alphaproteobacteria bacterium]